MSDSSVLLGIQDRVATITLNRPEASNALNLSMAVQLSDAVGYCKDDSSVRAVLLKANGEAFCAGGDIKVFAQQGDKLPEYLKETTTYLHSVISAFAHWDVPVIAMVNGVAAGAGMSLALAADLTIASESARFTMAYTRIGLTPDGSASYYLARLVGFKRALELVVTNRVLSAREALAWGIITRVVEDDDLDTEAMNLALELASGATKAFGASKRLLHEGWNQTLERQLEEESRIISEMSGTYDAKEAITAFIEKRKPNLQGI
ncbi:MAG: enoyl-CoA hydratase [Planctomycetes bacterium]|nr:enoyl-CoA hydratase [Planctomycetota bacterium]